MMPVKKELKEVARASAKGGESYSFWVFNVVGAIFIGILILVVAFLPSTRGEATNPILAVLALAALGSLCIWFGVRNFRGWKNKKKCWPYDWRNR
jgi:uncharacterized membrane protein YjgN (DUF898 family)